MKERALDGPRGGVDEREGRSMKSAGAVRLTAFEGAVLKVVLTIPFGETRSYAWVAKAIGRPNAVRAVGSVLRKNPWPLIIPCHRVIKSDGSFGQYAGRNTGRKRKLIELERNIVRAFGGQD